MPKELHDCVVAMKKKGYDEDRAYAICSTSTGWVRKEGGGWTKKKGKKHG